VKFRVLKVLIGYYYLLGHDTMHTGKISTMLWGRSINKLLLNYTGYDPKDNLLQSYYYYCKDLPKL
jgi:hypothetical protein